MSLVSKLRFTRCTLFFQTYDRGLRSYDWVTYLDEQFAVLWHEYVDARTELDESEYIVLRHLVTDLHV